LSKPLIADPKLQRQAANFHRDVFALFGGPKKLCSLCGKPGATDAAHVLRRSHLGPLRYADPQFARPAHRACHEKVDRYEVPWPKEIMLEAIRAHNRLAKIQIREPE
jgi:5-methylcytosine-specific restriction endonuclease McrA